MSRKTKGLIGRMAAVCLILSGSGTAAFFGWKAHSTQMEYEAGEDACDKLADLVNTDMVYRRLKEC